MRLVVDTNVFVSAALKESSWPGHTIRLIAKYGGLLKSIATEEELLAVLQRRRRTGGDQRATHAVPRSGRR